MKTYKMIGTLAVVIGLVLASVSAKASVLIINDGTGGVIPGGGATIGYQFVVGPTNLIATSLGFWDGDNNGTGMNNPDGLLTAHDVGLWNSSEFLLGSVNVPSLTAGTLVGEFRYAALSLPVTLTNGQTYRVGAYYGNSDLDRLHNASSTPTFSGYANTYNAVYNAGASMAFPNVFDGGPSIGYPQNAYIGPNILFEPVVPEPSSLLLMGVGGLLLWRRRKME